MSSHVGQATTYQVTVEQIADELAKRCILPTQVLVKLAESWLKMEHFAPHDSWGPAIKELVRQARAERGLK